MSVFQPFHSQVLIEMQEHLFEQPKTVVSLTVPSPEELDTAAWFSCTEKRDS